VSCCFVPPYLLRQLATVDDAALQRWGRATLQVDEHMRSRRRAGPLPRHALQAPTGRRVIHNAENTENLPGRVARRDDDPPVGDPAVDEAWASSGEAWELFEVEFDRRGVDGDGTTLTVTVHFGTAYDNAFWDGRQLVFGDGDGVVFERFTKPPDVMAHEFGHGVTQYTANLDYEGQPGALNESVSDVFAAMAKQRSAGQTAAEADWLIGVGLFRPGINARALRSMLEPGSAYDDPQLGRDPQVGSLADFVETEDDNGGVHINSGIPNRAFALAARTLGGYSWERVGRCWYDALTSGAVTARTDFAGFADATVASAARLFADDEAVAEAVRSGWNQVGVLAEGSAPVAVGSGSGFGAALREATRVAVRRTGGFAGIVRTGELDLRADARAEEIRQLLAHVDPAALSGDYGEPDRFVYTVEYGDTRVQVPEQALTPELHRVVQLVLGEGRGLSLE